MTTVFPTLCRSCQRLTGNGVCTSFRQGIPSDIYTFGDDHRVTIAGELPFVLDVAKRDGYEEWLQWTGESPAVQESFFDETLHPRGRGGRWIRSLRHFSQTIELPQPQAREFTGETFARRMDEFEHGGIRTVRMPRTRVQNLFANVNLDLQREGRRVGQAQVRLLPPNNRDERVAELTAIYLHSDEQNKGFGRAFTDHLLQTLRDGGVDKIRLTAVGTGSYAWARRGFVWDRRPDLQQQRILGDAKQAGRLEQIQRHVDTSELERKLKAGEFSSEAELAAWGVDEPWTNDKGRKTWAGKELLLGGNWTGERSLAPAPPPPPSIDYAARAREQTRAIQARYAALKNSFRQADLSDAQKESVADYIRGPAINALLRANEPLDQPGMLDYSTEAANIDAAIRSSHATRELIVYRGIGLSAGGEEPEFQFPSRAGEQYTDLGYTSTSYDPVIAREAAGDNPIAEIHIPAGAPALQTDKALGSDLPEQGDGQMEVLLPRGSSFRVTGTRVDEHGSYVQMDYVPPPEREWRTEPWQRGQTLAPKETYQQAWGFAKDAFDDGHVTAEEKQALTDYQGAYYGPVNKNLRGSDPYASVRARERGEDLQHALDTAIAKSTANRDMTVFRGANWPSAAELQVGDVYQDNGYTSTSLRESVAIGAVPPAHPGTIVEIRVPKGSHAVSMDVEGIGVGAFDESEVLLPRGSQFKVLEVHGGAHDPNWPSPEGEAPSRVVLEMVPNA